MLWELRDIVVRYPASSRPALDRVSLQVHANRWTAVLGPNGAGKSTLLRAALGTAPIASGEIRFRGRDVRHWPHRALAREIGVVPQSEGMVFSLTVQELVSQGRYPHLGPWGVEQPVDRAAIARAMATCEVTALAERELTTLSSGERQRTRIARALAQEPHVLALDEPTAALDLRYEMEIFELLRHLVQSGVTVFCVTHNLNLAARYADRIVLLHEGRIWADGSPTEVLTQTAIETVFGWPVQVMPHPGPGPDAGLPQIVPLAAAGASAQAGAPHVA